MQHEIKLVISLVLHIAVNNVEDKMPTFEVCLLKYKAALTCKELLHSVSETTCV